MASKRHEAIAFYLLVTSIVAIVVVTISFKYYFPDEISFFEDDAEIHTGENISYNVSIFDVPQHIFKISLFNMSAMYMPGYDANVRVIINTNFTETLSGPQDYVIYSEIYNGEINEFILTDGGLSVSFNMTFSALRNRNPTYISLATVSSVLALYYFYVSVNLKKEEEIVEEEH
ncbi:MAG: hypothetical protein ACTSQF_07915 [Candidatus Heimdallarchaeaceae archaeon]